MQLWMCFISWCLSLKFCSPKVSLNIIWIVHLDLNEVGSPLTRRRACCEASCLVDLTNRSVPNGASCWDQVENTQSMFESWGAKCFRVMRVMHLDLKPMVLIQVLHAKTKFIDMICWYKIIVFISLPYRFFCEVPSGGTTDIFHLSTTSHWKRNLKTKMTFVGMLIKSPCKKIL